MPARKTYRDKCADLVAEANRRLQRDTYGSIRLGEHNGSFFLRVYDSSCSPDTLGTTSVIGESPGEAFHWLEGYVCALSHVARREGRFTRKDENG